MKRNVRGTMSFTTLGTAALFLAVFLILLVFGARTYQQVAQGQEDNSQARAMLAYLSTSIRGCDDSGNVSVQAGEYGPVLVLGDGSGYAVRIYQANGRLLEEYSAVTAPLSPNMADELGLTETFEVESPAADTLRITTDEGQVLVHVRSGVDVP